MSLLALQQWREEEAAPELPTLEDMLTGPEWFALETATTLQRAVCRIAEGRSIDDLLELPLVENLEAYPPEVQERATWAWALGSREDLAGWTAVPKEVYLIAAIRCGKSLLISAWGVWASLHADWGSVGLRDGEVPRVPIVSTSKDNARAIGEHLRGAVRTGVGEHLTQRSRDALLDDSRDTVETIEVEHPDGTVVEVRVAAGARAGSTLVSRWLVGALFDEAPRMLPGEEGVVNFRDQARAVRGRVLTTLWAVGSPWAPVGEVYDTVEAHASRPTSERVVIRAVGPALNPYYWTPERCWELRRRDPDAYWTDVCAEFAASEGAAYPIGQLKACTREAPETIPPEPGVTYYAYMDPATRGNAWALTIGGVRETGRLTQVLCREWVPSHGPLDPQVVMAEIAEELRPYGVSTVVSDQWSSDSLVRFGANVGLHVSVVPATSRSNTNEAEELRKSLAAGTIELSPHPGVQSDLRRGKRTPRAEGGWRYTWPQTADGRHCDYGAVTVRLMATPSPTPYVSPHEDRPEGWSSEDLRLFERAVERVKRQGDPDHAGPRQRAQEDPYAWDE